ncbi:uncharacterized protein LOC125179002 [Hyalella azteca]|uniref:Uncharacterized protein LOC125179002 n=1 Tax=Hyalella azteca TaxID=294128 RepID=A0A979FUC9_HYAAZ|nr:uncharacterized protein LOC125179002 [Hyalella azteca]
MEVVCVVAIFLAAVATASGSGIRPEGMVPSRGIPLTHADLPNKFEGPARRTLETSLVKLRPEFVTRDYEKGNSIAAQLNGNTKLDFALLPRVKKTLTSDDLYKNYKIHQAQSFTTRLQSQEQSKSKTHLLNRALPTGRPAVQFKNENKPKITVKSVIKHDLHMPDTAGTPNEQLKRIIPNFKPSQMIRKGVFPPQGFLPFHPSAGDNNSSGNLMLVMPSKQLKLTKLPYSANELGGKMNQIPENHDMNSLRTVIGDLFLGRNQPNLKLPTEEITSIPRQFTISSTISKDSNLRKGLQVPLELIDPSTDPTERKSSSLGHFLERDTADSISHMSHYSDGQKIIKESEKNETVVKIELLNSSSVLESNWKGIDLGDVIKWASNDYELSKPEKVESSQISDNFATTETSPKPKVFKS